MKNKGFALIEILIALTILALLAAISYTALYTSMKKIEIESTISNVAYSSINVLNKTRVESVKGENYLTIDYEKGRLFSSEENGEIIASYQLPNDYHLESSPTSSIEPFSSTNKKGYYLNYLVNENSNSLTINTSFSFLVVSEYDDNVIREIIVDNGLPYVVGE